jgi:hypothetical protein
MEDVPLSVRAGRHDGAPAHLSRSLPDILSNSYEEKWIVIGGPTDCLPCCPDLNPLNLYLRRHVKTLVYVAPVDSE